MLTNNKLPGGRSRRDVLTPRPSLAPAALEAAQQPFKSRTWMAALRVICGRDGGDFTRTRRLGRDRLERLVRGEVTRGGAKRACFRITGKLFAALDDRAGVLAHRRGALERVHLLPVTPHGFPPLGRWSNTLVSRLGRRNPVPSPAAPDSPGRAVPGYGWPPGEACGAPNAPTRFMPPAIGI
ncbi:hypothetical protein OG203_05080 [Nocardia sp. NBC_01499]